MTLTWNDDAPAYRAEYGKYELIVYFCGAYNYSAKMTYNRTDHVVHEGLVTLREAKYKCELMMLRDVCERAGVML